MNVRAIRTPRIMTSNTDLLRVVDQALGKLEERSIVVVTSKIAAICEGRTVAVEDVDKSTLIEQEAERYLPAEMNKYHVALTIKNGALVPNAGIDESNGNGHYVLWPGHPYAVANQVRAHLRTRFALNQMGVIITDSHTTPLRWGVTGMAIGYSGFNPIKSYVGDTDLFGHELHYSTVNVADALAAAAVLVMGEGDEQTPLAVVSDLPFVTFQHDDPTPDEIRALRIDMEGDLYGPLLMGVAWLKGGSPGHSSAEAGLRTAASEVDR